ncbi:hypothetical protein WJX72_007992 [[Myrmecia] bisecta]|uniref:Uncharacterized protein n=1 Tax=[Myrmecia] bisecta TaxID=41462 RepID=A0AAW1QSD0_9CHLO
MLALKAACSAAAGGTMIRVTVDGRPKLEPYELEPPRTADSVIAAVATELEVPCGSLKAGQRLYAGKTAVPAGDYVFKATTARAKGAPVEDTHVPLRDVIHNPAPPLAMYSEFAGSFTASSGSQRVAHQAARVLQWAGFDNGLPDFIKASQKACCRLR